MKKERIFVLNFMNLDLMRVYFIFFIVFFKRDMEKIGLNIFVFGNIDVVGMI